MKQILLVFLLSLCACMGTRAGNRVALVIGCNRYANLAEGKQLTSPVADATDVAATLKALGYTLITGAAVTDASRDGIVTATENFAAQASGADAAVFYFSGHGIQVGDDNFLMPSDTPKLTSYSVLKNRGVQLRDTVMVALEEAQAKTKVIILDCCRENPFSDQVDEALGKLGKSLRSKGGLGEISGYGPGFFLAFATSPGTIADYGNGERNSPFTAALLTHLQTSADEDITPLFRKVKATVRERSGQDQVPWTNDSLDREFVFSSATRAAHVAMSPAAPLTPPQLPPPQPVTAKDTALGPAIVDGAYIQQINLPGGEQITLCYCHASSFVMGSPVSEANRDSNESQVMVRLTEDFWMARTECTQGQWEAIMGTNPSNFKGKGLPVERVSWEDAQAFLTTLNQKTTLPSGWKFALPTEAQWEYACRAGSETVFNFGNVLDGKQANCNGNYPYGTGVKGPYLEKTSEAGSYAPNSWGLYDMHGNVWEWCSDGYDGNLPGGADPLGPTTSRFRVIRGGAWHYNAGSCRAAIRYSYEPGYRFNSVGFRLALVPSTK